jgi:hypothetical protein
VLVAVKLARARQAERDALDTVEYRTAGLAIHYRLGCTEQEARRSLPCSGAR